MPFRAKTLRSIVTAACAFTLCMGEVSAASLSLGAGTVNTSALRMRAEPNTESSILTTVSLGENVVVTEDAGNNWYKVNYQGKEGYMSGDYLSVSTSGDLDLGSGKVQTGGAELNVRSGPGKNYEPIITISEGTVVSIDGIQDSWFKISGDDLSGWVSSEYVVPCADEIVTSSDNSTVASNSSMGQQIVDYAKRFLGKPYVWGGNGPNSFDCSGFTKFVYSHFGYSINRTASAQLANGVSVSRSELQPGDLIFFYNGKVSTPVSHVAIYVGGGQFIHACSDTRRVQYNSLSESNYNRKYVYARRIV